MACLEREISSYQSHITALKAELHDACVRENQCYVSYYYDYFCLTCVLSSRIKIDTNVRKTPCPMLTFFCVYHQLIGCTDMVAPLSEVEGNSGTLAISHTSVAVKDVPRNMRMPHKSTVPLKKNRSVKKNPQVTKVPQNHEHRNPITHWHVCCTNIYLSVDVAFWQIKLFDSHLSLLL